MKKNILVIGSLNMDLSVEMAKMPVTGETVLGRSIVYHPGGKGANQACAVGKLDGAVRMLGCVGQDEFGAALQKSLESAGVDVGDLRRCEEQPTGTAIICVNDQGDNSIVVVPGANQQCDEVYLEEKDSLFEWCDYVLMQMEIPHETISRAAERAKALGKTVILNPAPAPERISDELLKLVDYITPNETELARISGMDGRSPESIEAGASALIARGVKKVIVTMGEQGALLMGADGALTCPARRVKAVDTTAAGDCFNGAFVTALAEGRSEEEALRFANLASSVAVTRRGAQDSLPTRDELDRI